MIRPITQEIATTRKDIDIYSGWLNRLENPDPVLMTEAGGKGIKLYDEIARDAHASSVLQSRYLAVSGCEWEILPAESPTKRGRPATQSREQTIADTVKDILLNSNFSQMVQEIMQAVLYGFYVVEVLWKSDGKTIFPCRFISKHPRRFVFNLDREIRLITLNNMLDGEILPDRKFICHTWGDSDNPYGKGLGQKLWWPVWFKKNGLKFWLVFLEKFGMPTAIAKYPPGTSDADKSALLDALDAIQSESGIRIPDTMAVELLEASRSGTATYEAMCTYLDRQISKAVLGQTLTTEISDKGSFAAAQTHNDVRQDILKADADLLAELLNDTLIKWIVDYNFADITDYPKLWFRTDPEEDLKPLAERDKILSADIGLPMTRQYFYDTYGIPVPEDGEDLIEKPKPEPTQPPDKPDKSTKSTPSTKSTASFAETVGSLFPDQTAIDQIKDPAPDTITQTIKPVMDLISQGHSYQEVEDKLLEQYPTMNTSQVQQLMERAIFVSEVWGRLNA